jgi:hypothetical protein
LECAVAHGSVFYTGPRGCELINGAESAANEGARERRRRVEDAAETAGEVLGAFPRSVRYIITKKFIHKALLLQDAC